MNVTTDPESMTPEERRREVASILARGLLRRVCMNKTAASSPQKEISKESKSDLDLSAEKRLHVARRPAG
ncbi:MAG: hypothetical protein JXA69_06220 [Phycisphaerae bacterium]|nr:hypothetical protein [Phycisphaerae bacterium]